MSGPPLHHLDMDNVYEPIEFGAASQIVGIWHNAPGELLAVRFKQGSVYIYKYVTADIAEMFRKEGAKIDGSVGKLLKAVVEAFPVEHPFQKLASQAEIDAFLSAIPEAA